jgi:DNA-binding beta-propeller fold protein YncE
MSTYRLRTVLGLLGTFGVVSCGSNEMTPAVSSTNPAGNGYEVWVIDQSDSPGQNHGGTLYVFHGDDFSASATSVPAPAERIDLGASASALCRGATGSNPVRPHMVLFNREHTHASVAFVASGHVLLLDAATREPLDCIRTTQAPTGQQAHAAYPSPDGSYILVANQNGKRIERIDADFGANRFTHNVGATLDLATCTTPSGGPCEAADLRPDNAPICPVLSDDGDLAFVTLRGGGLLVIDPRPTPMRIVAEYDMATVKGNGCGGEELDGQMYVNSGGRPGPMDHLHLYGFEVYRFPLAAFAARGDGFAPNQPAPVLVFSREGEHDSHGMVVTGNNEYLWVMDRHGDVVEVLSAADDRHVNTIPLNGVHTDNAAPDLTDRSPAGDLVFVAFRGPTPLSGDPHIATGTTPGLGVLRVTEGGRDGEVIGIARLTNVGADGVERADPHALRVRQID